MTTLAASLFNRENQFRELAEVTTDWFFELDHDLRFTVHTGSESTVGYDGTTLLGLRAWEVPGLLIDTAYRNKLRHACENHLPFHKILGTVRDSKGKEFHGLISGVPVFSGDGDFVGYRGLGIDLTAKINAERSIAATTRIFEAIDNVQKCVIDGLALDEVRRRIMENARWLTESRVAFFATLPRPSADPSMLVVQWLTSFNSHAQQDDTPLFQSFESAQLALVLPLARFVAAAKRTVVWNDRADQRFHALNPTQAPGPFDNFLGIPLHDEDHVVAVLGLADRAEGYDDNLPEFLRPFIDASVAVKSAIKAKSERETAVAGLIHNQRRLAFLLGGGDMAMWELNCRSNSLDVEGSLHSALGYDKEEVPKNLAQHIEWVHPDDRPVLEAKLSSLDDTDCNGYEVTLRLLAKDQSWRWLLERGRVAERDAHGAPVRILGGWLDITERQSKELKLRQAQKMEAIGQLVGGIAHDFNNIMMIVGGYVQRMVDRKDDQEVLSSSLKQIQDAIAKANKLTAGLMTFSRSNQHDSRVFCVDTEVENMTELLSRALDERFELVLDLQAPHLRVNADASELGQALLNLVVNARDAMSLKGGAIFAGTRAPQGALKDASSNQPKPSQAFIEIFVQDYGMGMDERVLAHVFEPFFTTKAQGKGTGLGLAMVYAFCKQNGGEARIESTSGQGTKVSMLLPITTDAIGNSTGADSTIEIDASGKGEMVLLVEDDPALLRLVEESLRRMGYHVKAAASGFEALEIALSAERDIDVVLTDIVMPNLGGIELAQIFREQNPALPIVFMSGYPSRGDRDYGTLPEGACFVQKPVKPTDLAKILRQELERAQLRRAG